MSLFVCSQCRCVENTALSNFWSFLGNKDGIALCSECDPKIGEWHGIFTKLPYNPETQVVQYDGTTHLTDER